MPENESLDALLRKGDPAGSPPSITRSATERYNRLLPRLVEEGVATRHDTNPKRLWVAAPAMALALLAAVLFWRGQGKTMPQPIASPSVEQVAQDKSPAPLPTVKPTPAVPLPKKKEAKSQRTISPQRYRKRVRVASDYHPRRRHYRRIRRHSRPVAPPAPVERIVIENVQPPAPVAIAIVGEGENLSVTSTFKEEKS